MEKETPRLGGRGAIRQVFGIRNYRYFLLGQFVSSSGNWVQRVAMAWLAWELTESPAWLGIIAFADMFPTFAVGLIAGAVIDRSDSLKVLRLTQLLSILQATVLAAVVFSGIVAIEWLVSLALVRGVIIAFNRPARLTTIYYLTGGTFLSSAIAVNAMIFNSSRFLGPALAGLIIAGWGVGWAFVFNAVSFIAFYVALMAIRIQPAPMRERQKSGLAADAMAGLRYALSAAGIAFLLVVIVLDSLFVRPFIELLAGFAADVFGRGASAYSMLLTLHGIGAMAGSYWLARRGGIVGYTRIIVTTLLVLAVALLTFALAQNYWVALAMMPVTGAAFVIQGIAIQTLLQTAVAPEMRGRVMGLYGIVSRGTPAAGALVMGAASAVLGLPAPVAGGAILCLVLWLWARSRQTAMTRLLEPAPAPTDHRYKKIIRNPSESHKTSTDGY